MSAASVKSHLVKTNRYFSRWVRNSDNVEVEVVELANGINDDVQVLDMSTRKVFWSTMGEIEIFYTEKDWK